MASNIFKKTSKLFLIGIATIVGVFLAFFSKSSWLETIDYSRQMAQKSGNDSGKPFSGIPSAKADLIQLYIPIGDNGDGGGDGG